MSDKLALQNGTKISWWGLLPQSMDVGADVPLTSENFQKIPKFDGEYTPLLFTITDPTLVGLPPKMQQKNDWLNFEVEIQTYLYHNRFWKPQNDFNEEHNVNFMQINFKGIEHRDIPKIKLPVIERLMFEMAMYHLKWDFTDWPHKQVGEENYQSYVEDMESIRAELDIFPDFDLDTVAPLASKKEMKQILLAVEYVHFVEYFRYQNATTLMATPQLVGDYDYWWKWMYTNSISEKSKEDRNKKKRVLQTTLSRIDEKVLTRYAKKGTVGGDLTGFAFKSYTNWIKSNYKNDYGVQDDWAILGAVGVGNTKEEK